MRTAGSSTERSILTTGPLSASLGAAAGSKDGIFSMASSLAATGTGTTLGWDPARDASLGMPSGSLKDALS